MKSKSKRLLSTLLVFALVSGLLTAMPTTASAATTHTVSSESELYDLLYTVAVANGDTIKLMDNITYTHDLILAGASGGLTITLDLNGKMLNATSGVYMDSQSGILLKDPNNGQFNVSGVSGLSTASVCTDGAGAKVEVSNITFSTNGDSAVSARSGSEIIVYGDITHTGASGYGVIVRNGSKVTVNGAITVSSSVTFARVEGANKTRTQYEATSSKPGYLEYKTTDGSYTSYLWVKDPAATIPNATVNPTTASFIKGSSGDISLTVDLAGHTPQSIKNGNYTLQYDTDFVIIGSNTVTLKAAYLNTLDVGVHTITFNFSGGVSPTLTITVTGVAPTITGPTTMTLAQGYAATSSGLFTITGNPAPTVTKTSGNAAITWNNGTMKLDIAAGLAAGTYPVVLTATSGTSTATLTFTLTVSAFASGSMSNFTKAKTYSAGLFSDVNEDRWYGLNQQKVIANAYEYGLMQGSGNTFNPTGNMTLAEAVTIAARVHHIYNGGDGVFTQGSPWFQVYVDYAIGNGIINAGTFSNYSKAATRAEMAYIFSRALPETEFVSQNTVYSLPDVNNSTPYREAIFMLYRAGIVEGDSAGAFKPGNNITRAEASAIISRVILPATRISGKTF